MDQPNRSDRWTTGFWLVAASDTLKRPAGSGGRRQEIPVGSGSIGGVAQARLASTVVTATTVSRYG
jgi:hypothetical protein